MQAQHHAAVAQLLDIYQRLFRLYQAFPCQQHFGQHGNGALHIRLVADADGGAQPPQGLGVVIGDVPAGKGAVRQGDDLIVHHAQGGKKQSDLHNGALNIRGGFDVIPGLKGVQEHDEEPAGKVGKAALQRQADGNADRAQQRHEAGGRDSQKIGDQVNQQRPQGHPRQRADEFAQAGVQPGFVIQQRHPGQEMVDQPPPGQKDDDGQCDVPQSRKDKGRGLVNKLLDRGEGISKLRGECGKGKQHGSGSPFFVKVRRRGRARRPRDIGRAVPCRPAKSRPPPPPASRAAPAARQRQSPAPGCRRGIRPGGRESRRGRGCGAAPRPRCGTRGDGPPAGRSARRWPPVPRGSAKRPRKQPRRNGSAWRILLPARFWLVPL